MEVVLTFTRTIHAMAAEQLLQGNGFSVNVMNLPSSIQAGCGICLRLRPDDAPGALLLLEQNHIPTGECYWRQLQNGKSNYIPYKEGD